jgi:hypothetical protein
VQGVALRSAAYNLPRWIRGTAPEGEIVVKNVFAVGSVCFLVACDGGQPQSTQYTKSANCNGASVSTIRFAPEPTARMFPEAIWFEQCPDGKYYRKIGDGQWKEITKKQADDGASMLKTAGRRVVRVVD